MSEKKYYMFRPEGQDEGEVALLTDAEYQAIQKRITDLFGDDDPAFYIYPVDGTATFEELMQMLDAEKEELEASRKLG